MFYKPILPIIKIILYYIYILLHHYSITITYNTYIQYIYALKNSVEGLIRVRSTAYPPTHKSLSQRGWDVYDLKIGFLYIELI